MVKARIDMMQAEKEEHIIDLLPYLKGRKPSRTSGCLDHRQSPVDFVDGFLVG